MPAQTIYKAAQIISRTGEQINQMLNKIDELVATYTSHSDVFSKAVSRSDDMTDISEWIYISEIRCFGLIEKRKQSKESIQLGFLVRILDEKESTDVPNWEPCLYVLITHIEANEAWGLNEFNLHSAIQDGYALNQNKNIFFWEDEGSRGGVYVLPLTAISDEEILSKKIVRPAFQLAEELLSGPMPMVESNPPLAFNYEEIDGKLSIVS